MSVPVILVLAAMTYVSRAAAVVLLPPPPPRMAALLDRMPAPLFAGLAAVALVGDGGDVAAAPVLAAVAGALLVARTRSLGLVLAAGLTGAVAVTVLT